MTKKEDLRRSSEVNGHSVVDCLFGTTNRLCEFQFERIVQRKLESSLSKVSNRSRTESGRQSSQPFLGNDLSTGSDHSEFRKFRVELDSGLNDINLQCFQTYEGQREKGGRGRESIWWKSGNKAGECLLEPCLHAKAYNTELPPQRIWHNYRRNGQQRVTRRITDGE